jgi:hypothetical protein
VPRHTRAADAAAIRQGEEPDEEQDGLRFSVSKTTREMERISQPDLKPEDVPQLTVDVSVAPD